MPEKPKDLPKAFQFTLLEVEVAALSSMALVGAQAAMDLDIRPWIRRLRTKVTMIGEPVFAGVGQKMANLCRNVNPQLINDLYWDQVAEEIATECPHKAALRKVREELMELLSVPANETVGDLGGRIVNLIDFIDEKPGMGR